MSSGSFDLAPLLGTHIRRRVGKILVLVFSLSFFSAFFLSSLFAASSVRLLLRMRQKAGGVKKDGFHAIYKGWFWSEVFRISTYKLVHFPPDLFEGSSYLRPPSSKG